ncbi:MAG TPA: carbohydrate kinase family protein [Anaerolineae bacterium]|nr:carbohydrate kinase family protein [Anaerolineae bacterium]
MIGHPSPSVLVIGSAGLDIKGLASGPLLPGTSNAGRVRRSLGGVARNVAENLARLDVDVTLLTAVGDDDAGTQILQQASECGVDTSPSIVVSGGRTGSYLAIVDENGSLAVAIGDMGIAESITPRYLNDHRRLFAEASMLAIDANLTPDALSTILKLAAKHDLLVCADPTSTALADRLCPHLRQLHLIAPNVAEAAVLSGLPPASTQDEALDVARHLVSLGVDFAILTLADQGSAYATSEESGLVPAMHVDIVDPSGAGDALTAALIFAVLNDIPTDEAVRLGIAAATLTLQSRETVNPELSLEKLYAQLAA